MKTAIILTGHMRSFERCLPTLHWHVARHFPDADWYVSTIADPNADKAELLRTRYPGAHVKVARTAEQPDCVSEMRAAGVSLPVEWFRGKPYTHEGYPISVHPQAVLRQLWQLREGWRLYAESDRPADVVIRCRPDLFFRCGDIAHYARSIARWSALVPWWGNFGGVNDRFALLGTQAAEQYFATYDAIPALMSLGCPLHPESLVAAQLEAGSVDVSRISVSFGSLRENGDVREPEVNNDDLDRLITGR